MGTDRQRMKDYNFDYRYLIPEAVTFTILRNPLDAFESLYAYYNIAPKFKLSIHEYIQT